MRAPETTVKAVPWKLKEDDGEEAFAVVISSAFNGARDVIRKRLGDTSPCERQVRDGRKL